MQMEEEINVLRPLGFSSNSLKPEQRNYGPGERECFALIAAARKWKTYCRAANELYFITDHEPLKWLRGRKDPHGKYARWIIELEGLSYKVIPRNGLNHVVPDCLSRIQNPDQDEIVHQDEYFFDNRIFSVANDDARLKEEQGNDRAISLAIVQLRENNEIRKGRYKR